MILGLDMLVGTNYVKYDHLSKIVYSAYMGSNANTLNVFIDLNSIIKPLFGSTDGACAYEVKDKLELSSHIINMCAHYRQFFNRIQVDSRFFLVFGLNCPEANNILVSGYNNTFVSSFTKKKEMREMVLNNMKALEILCPYLPDIFYFDARDNEVSAFIEHIIKQMKFDDRKIYPLMENIVISKDVLTLQLVSSCNVKILRPKKSNGADMSFIIDHNTFWISFMSKIRNVKVPAINIPDNIYGNILAMSRVPERCMSSIKSLPQTYGIFEKMFSMGYITGEQLYTQSTINSILQMLQVSHNPTELEMRWKAISTDFQASYIIGNNPIYKMIKMDNINDVKGLHSIANKEYANCPLDLERL